MYDLIVSFTNPETTGRKEKLSLDSKVQTRNGQKAVHRKKRKKSMNFGTLRLV